LDQLCIAAPIAGLLLDRFNKRGDPHDTTGYTVLFLVAAAWILLGVVAVARLRKVK
jgi:hypothetical protein